MNDFIGQPLSIDDWVAIMRPNYREMVLAKVIAFTPKKVRVRYKVHYGKDLYEEYLTEPSNVVFIAPTDALAKLLKNA